MVRTTQDGVGEILTNLEDRLSEGSAHMTVELDPIRSDAAKRDGAMNERLATGLYPPAV